MGLINPFIQGDDLGVKSVVKAGVFLFVLAMILSFFAMQNGERSKSQVLENSRSLMSRISSLENQLTDQEFKSNKAHYNQKGKEKLIQLKAGIAQKRKALLLCESDSRERRCDILMQRNQNIAYKADVLSKIRKKEIGVSYKEIVANNGEIYHDAKIKSLSLHGVTISHRAGISGINISEMPSTWQKKLMFIQSKSD